MRAHASNLIKAPLHLLERGLSFLIAASTRHPNLLNLPSHLRSSLHGGTHLSNLTKSLLYFPCLKEALPLSGPWSNTKTNITLKYHLLEDKYYIYLLISVIIDIFWYIKLAMFFEPNATQNQRERRLDCFRDPSKSMKGGMEFYFESCQ
jgi:hypothetical protein